jgi:hypothetical protein
VKYPVPREVPVRRCNLLWVCPCCNPLGTAGASDAAWCVPADPGP